MDTYEFLSHILPDSGVYVLAQRFPSGAIKQRFFTDLHEMANIVKRLDGAGSDIYHACAAFKEAGNRTQANVDKLKSFYLDIDIGEGKDYKTQKEAVLELQRVCEELGWAIPTIVSSGRGLHCYWTFSSAVMGDVWKAAAGNLRQALDHLNFKHDPSRTTDQASILRPVGSTWRKDGERPVKAIKVTPPVEFVSLMKPLLTFLVKNGIKPETARRKVHNPVFDMFKGDEALVAKKEFPPSSAHEIVKHCAHVAQMSTLKGAIAEPEWHINIGLLKHTSEGEAICHEWSKGDSRYSHKATQAKIDNWVGGPPKCETFELQNKALCEGCKFKGKVSSPIQLGYHAEEEKDPPKQKLAGGADPRAFKPRGFSWNDKRKEMSILKKNDDGINEWVPFCDTEFYPTTRVQLPDGTWGQRMEMVLANGKIRVFDVPTKLIAKPDLLSQLLASYEIIVNLGKEFYVVVYITEYLKNFKKNGVEMQLFDRFGWHGDGFLVNNTMISNGSVKEVTLSEGLTKNDSFQIKHTANPKADIKEWARIFNLIYNRPKAEPYQFAALAMLCSPLIGLINDGMWHGIPIAFTGEGSQGKTSLGKVTVSAFTDPETFTWNAGAASDRAIDAIVGKFHNLPVVLDELTGRSPASLSEKLMALSSGQSRVIATQKGDLSDVAWKWDTCAYITGNTNLTQALSSLEPARAEASMARVFEVTFQRGEMEQIFTGIDFQALEAELFNNHCGAVAPAYISAIIANKDTIIQKFRELRSSIKGPKGLPFLSKERFFKDLIITSLIAGRILKGLGVVQFDVDKTIEWAKDHVAQMRETSSDNLLTIGDQLAKFLGSLAGGIVVTKTFNRATSERPMTDVYPIRSGIKARMAITDRKLYVSVAAYNEWCRENNINGTALRKELLREKYLLSNTAKAMKLTMGCNIPSSRQRVLEFSYDETVGKPSTGSSSVTKLNPPQKEA